MEQQQQQVQSFCASHSKVTMVEFVHATSSINRYSREWKTQINLTYITYHPHSTCHYYIYCFCPNSPDLSTLVWNFPELLLFDISGLAPREGFSITRLWTLRSLPGGAAGFSIRSRLGALYDCGLNTTDDCKLAQRTQLFEMGKFSRIYEYYYCRTTHAPGSAG